MTRRLIVHADDFGISNEVNEAIITAHREGVLTSCSLMVTGEAADAAVRLAKEHPTLAVGIHLVTVMGKTRLPHQEVPTITDARGALTDDPARAGLSYFFHPRARREIQREIAAQFAAFAATGLPLSHVDAHLHLHIHPVIFAAAMRGAESLGVRRMRVPHDDLETALSFDRSDLLRKRVDAALFGVFSRLMKARLRRRGFLFPARVFGNFQSGRMSEAYFVHVLERLRDGTSEIYFHPAMPCARGAAGATELRALTSERVRSRIRDLGIELTTYVQLEPDQPAASHDGHPRT